MIPRTGWELHLPTKSPGHTPRRPLEPEGVHPVDAGLPLSDLEKTDPAGAPPVPPPGTPEEPGEGSGG